MRLDHAWFCALFLIACLAALLPLLIVHPAPLVDWPNHLARTDILTQLLAGEGSWGQYYRLNQFILPNAALDFGVVVLHALGLAVDTAARVFLVATFAAFVSGAIALAKALDHSDPTKPLLAIVLFCNGAFSDGFVNYMAGLGCAFWVLAVWVRAADHPVRRLLIAGLGCAAVFFAHLIAAVFLMAVLGLLELDALLARGLRARTLARHLSALLGGAVILLLLKLSPTGDDVLSAESAHAISYAGGPSLLGVLKDKLLLPGHALLDGGRMMGAAIMAAGLLAFSVAALRGARLALDRRGVLLVIGLNSIWLLAPTRIGEGLYLDYRLVPAALMGVVIATQFRWRSSRALHWAFGILLLMSLCRSASFAIDYRRYAETYAAFDRAAAAIVPDSVLLTAIGSRRDAIPWERLWSPPLDHLVTLAVRREVFVPTVFAFQSQHSIVLQPTYAGWGRRSFIADSVTSTASRAFIASVCAAWSKQGHRGRVYLAVVYPTDFSDTVFAGHVVTAAGPGFKLGEPCEG